MLWRRTFAYGFDLLVLAGLAVLAWLVIIPLIVLSFGLLAAPLWFAYALVPIAYHTLLVGGPRNATLGQRVFDLRVIDIDGGPPTYVQAAAQTMLFYVTVALTSFLALLFVFFNPNRRTLHDLLSGVLVVRAGRSRGSAVLPPRSP